MRALLTTAAMAALLLASTAQARPKGVEHLTPYSRTADGITGPVDLSPTEMKAAGVRFPLRVAADVPAFKADIGTFPARILQVTRPMNPVLLNHNRLCGAPVRWIVVYRFGKTSLGMSVFSSKAQPVSDDSPGLCGTFNYDR